MAPDEPLPLTDDSLPPGGRAEEALVPQDSPLRHPDIEREWVVRGIEQIQVHQKAEGHLGEALQALHEKKYLEAIGFFRQAIEEHPEFPEVHYFLGIAHFLLGMHTEALRCYQETLTMNPAHYGAYVQLGIVQYLLGDHTAAIEAYTRAIELNPDMSETHVRLGNVYAAVGRRKEAVDAYAQALRIRLESMAQEAAEGETGPQAERNPGEDQR